MEIVKLIHKYQRGGQIELNGPPVPPGKKFRAPVDGQGCFEAPVDVAERLLVVLGAEVALAPGQVLHPEPAADSESEWPPRERPASNKKAKEGDR